MQQQVITNKLLRQQQNLYSIREVAALCGLKGPNAWFNEVKAGVVPPPSTKMAYVVTRNNSLFYTGEQVAMFKERFSNIRKSLVSIAQMAEHLSCDVTQLRTYIAQRRIPKPTHEYKRRRFYCEEEIEEIKSCYSKIRNYRESLLHRAKNHGLYTCTATAKLLNMPYITFQVWLAKGKIPKPTRKMEGSIFKFYNDDDVNDIRQMMSDYLRNRGKK